MYLISTGTKPYIRYYTELIEAITFVDIGREEKWQEKMREARLVPGGMGGVLINDGTGMTQQISEGVK